MKTKMTEEEIKKYLSKKWKEREKLRKEADKLHTEGRKLWMEAEKLHIKKGKFCAKGNKLYVEGNKLYVKANELYIDAVIEVHGPDAIINWEDGSIKNTGESKGEKLWVEKKKLDIV